MTPHSSPTRAEFARWVQDALNRLYDATYLRTHPLAEVLATPDTSKLQRGQHLRRLLLDAIHALSPGAGTPAQSADWRAYRILELRYIEGLAPAEVMQQLAFSRSYYFREQSRMLDALADALWEQRQQALEAPPTPDTTREQLAQAETERLSAHATWEALDPVQVLDAMHELIDSLAHAQGVAAQFDLHQPIIIQHSDRVVLRQALLSAIAYAVDVAAGGRITISSFVEVAETGIRVLAWAPARAAPASVLVGVEHDSTIETPDRQGVGLDVCRRLMVTMGGALAVRAVDAGWEARLVWPLAAQRTLLVIDDNQDFADLFRRYLVGHNWQVIGAADGIAARQLLAERLPTAIILDVMMPREDGWELLAALRADARTSAIPVVICSVLNEPRLASALGATGYLHKPVTQPALLRALAPWSQADASPAPAR